MAQESGTADGARPSLAAGILQGEIRIDGLLTEETWEGAPLAGALTMIEPVEGGVKTGETQVRVLASPEVLVIGIEALDPDPSGSSPPRRPETPTSERRTTSRSYSIRSWTGGPATSSP